MDSPSNLPAQAPDLPQGLADAQQAYRAAFAAAIEPEPEITTSQWADEYRVLSAKASSEPGRWRTSRVPYTREIMDCLSPSHPCTEVTFAKGTQIAGTELGYNWLGAIVDRWPGPTMLVMPTVDTAKRNSKQRLQPMIDDTAALRAKMSDPKSRDSGNTVLMKEFPGGVLVLTGANSGPGLRSMPVRFLMLDECDAYPADVDGEGDPCVLAEKRTATFARRKIYRVSSPKDKGGRIERYFAASDQRRYHVPCPHCAHDQWLRWEQMRWRMREVVELACTDCGVVHQLLADSEITACGACGAPPEKQRPTTRQTDEIADVWYECVACQGEIREQHKTRMLESGHWVAHNPGPGRQPGFHLSALYSPVGWFSWREAVKQYLEALLDSTKELLKVFTNTVLGEGWEDAGDKIEAEPLRTRVETIRLGQVPAYALLLTASVDVQGDRLEYKVKGWGRGEESGVVDYGQIYGDPAREGPESVWGELEKLIDRAYPHAGGATLRITAMAIDSGGHHTQEVYRFCAKWSRRRVFAVKGSSVLGKSVYNGLKPVEITHRGRKLASGALLGIIGTDTAKNAIFNRLAIAEPGPGYMHFPSGLPDTYFDQLTAERRVSRDVKGFERYNWVKQPGARNEALDLEVYAYAAAIYAGVTRMRPADWDALEQVLNPQQRDLFGAPKAAAPSQVSQEPPQEAPQETPDAAALAAPITVLPGGVIAGAKPIVIRPPRAGG